MKNVSREPAPAETVIGQATHAPGPWIAGVAEVDGCGIVLAVTVDGGENGFVVARYGIEKEDWANARLIAAAPDLLAMLRLVTDQYEQICQDNHVMGWPLMVRTAKATIAKAEGRT
jgi:hypothetical protein